MPFALGGFLGQDVTHIGLVSLYLARPGDPKTLGRTSVGFDL
jgi:hypothetical protein